jgi:phosphohistidine phosphatase
MPKLYLLRHTESSSSIVTQDIERTLTSNGIDQAKDIGQYFRKHGNDVDLVMCSVSKRTQMTLFIAQMSGFSPKKTEVIEKLYNAPAEELFSQVHKSKENNILLIAHNPGIQELAKILCGSGDPKKMEMLNTFYTPGTLSIIDCRIESWSDLRMRENTLIDIIVPN